MSFSPIDIQAAFKKLPFPVREFVSDPEFGETLAQIGESRKLTPEQITSFGDLVTEVAIGLAPPAELPNKLVALGLEKPAVGFLMSELKIKILDPLGGRFKQKEEEPAKEPEVVAEKAPEPDLHPAIIASVTPAKPLVPAITPSINRLESGVSRPASVPPATPVAPKVIPPPVSHPAPRPIAPISVEPRVRTMAMDVEATSHTSKDGDARHSPPAHTVPVPRPSVAPASMTAPLPGTTAPGLPGVPKEYGVDPYREPVE